MNFLFLILLSKSSFSYVGGWGELWGVLSFLTDTTRLSYPRVKSWQQFLCILNSLTMRSKSLTSLILYFSLLLMLRWCHSWHWKFLLNMVWPSRCYLTFWTLNINYILLYKPGMQLFLLVILMANLNELTFDFLQKQSVETVCFHWSM